MLAILLLAPAAPPAFVVENKCPPAFVVENLCPKPTPKVDPKPKTQLWLVDGKLVELPVGTTPPLPSSPPNGRCTPFR